MANENLSSLILRLKRETNSITMNPTLDAIDLNLIDKFSVVDDPFYKKKLNEIYDYLKDANYLFTPKYKSAFDAYNELATFDFLNTKIKTEFVKEKKDAKTPDFKLLLSDTEYIYSDLKTLHYFNGNLNYKDIQEQSTNSNIKMDKEIKKKRSVVMGDPIEISPFKKDKDLRHYNLKNIIEDIIVKCSGLLKIEQVNYMQTHGILLIDTGHLSLPPILEIGLPIHEGHQYKELNSGLLWNAVFGEIGDPTYNWIEFEGKPNIGERLEMNGLLKDDAFKDLKAIAFITSSFWSNKKIIGFHRSFEELSNTKDILFRISDFVNDEVNSNYWQLTKYGDTSTI